MNTNQKIERVNRLAASERLTGPEKINAAQTITGGGGSEIRVAYCKEAPGEGNTLQCFLDTDTTGAEVAVYFTILDAAGTNTDLENCDLSLVDGTPIPVHKRSDGNWWYLVPVETVTEKDC